MSGYRANGAGSPYTFLIDNRSENIMHPVTGQAAQSTERQRIIQSQPRISEHNQLDDHSQSLGNWSANNFDYTQRYPQHWSSSTHSSASSHARSSDNSIFSQSRISTVSTDSSSSGFSSFSRNHYVTQAEQLLTGHSSPCQFYAAVPLEDSAPPTSRKRHTPRTPAPAKDYYKTCVSRKQRARRSETVPKFFCTVCEEPFVEKADWKRHEETFQERPEEFQCDNCSAKYFLDKDFVMHHVSAHGCVPCNTSTKCSLKKHVQESKRPRTTRSGWGCGFCCHFSSSWTERCNHIANHFDAGGQTMSDWKHSRVIYSLLQRPELVRAWNTVLESKQRAFIAFGWDPKSTGRVEGYPDSTQILQLQDELEYFARDQDPVALARKAFNLAVATVKHDAPPPVPPKDYRVNHKASLQDIMNETESWTQFVRSITNDEYLPTRVTHLESGALDEELNSWYDDETF